MRIEIDREEYGRWIAEIPDLSGVMVYGVTRQEAISKAEALALRVIADRLDYGEKVSAAGWVASRRTVLLRRFPGVFSATITKRTAREDRSTSMRNRTFPVKYATKKGYPS